MTDGSFMAVLANGTHEVRTGVFEYQSSWHEWVRRCTFDCRGRVVKFVYAWGGELQQYTPREFREVFHGE